ncbi:hypothetical protein HD806DRAFT_523649 [Xylariaceae sp. AK1471]|nr:hypothetical protein HD806DRAFT_523649 [Xylariaceae sp. AK1471]
MDYLATIFDMNETQLRNRVLYYVWLIAAQISFAGLLFVVFWAVFVPPPTKLKYEILTADNKTYPSGQLSWMQHFEALPCGKTPEEAKARGCHFDMVATAWLPPRCIDYELVDDFIERGNWKFYTEYHGTTEYESYDADTLGAMSTTIWTTRRWHATHCFYMWKKLNRALVNSWTADAETVSEPHTDHCMKVFEELLYGPHLDPMEVETYLEVIYPPC